VNPVDGDVVLLAPVEWRVRFGERRTVRPFGLVGISLDFDNRSTRDVEMTLRQFGANGGNVVDVSAAVREQRILGSQLELGDGGVWVQTVSSKGLQYELGGYFPDDGPLHLGPIVALENLPDGARGRGAPG